MKKKFEIGSIFEISAPTGYHFLQLAHWTESELPLLGVLKKKCSKPAKDLNIGIIIYQYFILYALEAAVRRKFVRYLGVAPVPEQYRVFPSLRVAGHVELEGTVKNWFVYNVPITFNYKRLIDKNVRYRVEKLSNKERQLSIADIISHATLQSRLTSNWKPEDLTDHY